MRNLWLVARREFTSRGRSGAYLVSTLVMVISLFASTLLPAFMDKKPEALNILLLDQTGQVAAPLKATIDAMPAQSGGSKVNLEVVSGNVDVLRAQAVDEKKALLVVDGTFPGTVRARFMASSPGTLQTAGLVLGPLEGIVRSALAEARGIDARVAGELIKPLQAETIQVTASGERGQDDFQSSFLLAFGIVMALYIVILMNGQFVFQGILEEKMSRVMEVMAAAVGPREMLAGKVLGLGALGLLQFVLTILAWFGGSLVSKQITGSAIEHVAWGTSAIALAFLILGYLLGATLMAGAAATISRMEDQQVVLTPIMLLMAVPVMIMPMLLEDPNSTLATVLSLIPFFSQSMMVFRVMITDVPLWQVATSLSLMLATTIWAVWAGGRVYRAAMLSYGGRPSMKQIWGYLRG